MITDKFLARKMCPKTTRTKQKVKQSRLSQDCWKTKYGTNPTPDDPPISFLKAYQLKIRV